MLSEAHPSKEDGWGIPFCGGIGNASARLGQPPEIVIRVVDRNHWRETSPFKAKPGTWTIRL